MLAAGVVEPCAPGSEPGELGPLRMRLTHFLERLQNYSPSMIIRSLGYEIPLFQELAILYGRQREFDKSLGYCDPLLSSLYSLFKSDGFILMRRNR